METVARFEKVSKEIFITQILDLFRGKPGMDEEKAAKIHERIRLPKRATAGSAGYDIFIPFDIYLKPGESLLIPTGIRVKMKEGWCLFIVPRSGLGSKFRFQLNNSTGVIDSDYYSSDNEGHILVPMINDSRNGNAVELRAGSAFVQGVFINYGITDDDATSAERNGGFGSTS